jgi:hypothetical protein
MQPSPAWRSCILRLAIKLYGFRVCAFATRTPVPTAPGCFVFGVLLRVKKGIIVYFADAQLFAVEQ